MTRISDIDESRRQFLLYLLATGSLTPLAAQSASLSRLPSRLPPGQSIYRLRGDVTINGIAASLNSPVKAGDIIETGARSFVIFAYEQDAFILRSNSEMTVRPGPEEPQPKGKEKTRKTIASAMIPTAYSLKRGKALSVMASRRTRIATPTAVVGIRGTGVYLEADPEESYVCVCYGATDLSSPLNPGVSETVVSEHHDEPKYITGGSNPRILPAPFKNHDDQELLLIETLVGRTTPYVVPRGVPRTRNSYF